jgi:hypothetical protein
MASLPLTGAALELSLATHSTRNVTLCLTAFAQLAFVQGDGERAALLAGAAEGGHLENVPPDPKEEVESYIL